MILGAGGQISKGVVEIQYLRALAALMVCSTHILHSMFLEFPVEKFRTFYLGSGVDLFFAISGFILSLSADKLYGTPDGWKVFLIRRMRRIVPFYWIATTLFIIFLFVASRSIPNPLTIASSYLFLPYSPVNDHSGMVFPIFGFGWTLNYEMQFYAIFAAFLFLPRMKATVAVVSCMILLSVLGTLVTFESVAMTFWTRPIILEFCFGIVIGLLYKSGVRIPAYVSVSFVAFAIVAIGLGPLDSFMTENGELPLNTFVRVAGWGVPMAMVVAAFALGPRFRKSDIQWLKALGDSSYSLFLLHTFVVTAMVQVFRHLPIDQGAKGPLFFAATLGGSILLALLSFRFFEQPLLRFFKRVLPERPAASFA